MASIELGCQRLDLSRPLEPDEGLHTGTTSVSKADVTILTTACSVVKGPFDGSGWALVAIHQSQLGASK